GQDRGVLFMALNASISRQFEFVQMQWLNDGNIFALGPDKDVITGDHSGADKMTVNGAPPYFLGHLPRFVTVKGGEYFFMPGMNALRWLASGEATPPAQSVAPAAHHVSFIEDMEAL